MSNHRHGRRRRTSAIHSEPLEPRRYLANAASFLAGVRKTLAGTPTGDVLFYDGVTPLGDAQLQPDGTASIQFSGFSTGDNDITARYPGDATFLGSTSAPFNQQSGISGGGGGGGGGGSKPINIKPGKSTKITFKLTSGTYFVVLRLDDDNSLANVTNPDTIVVSSGQVTVT